MINLALFANSPKFYYFSLYSVRFNDICYLLACFKGRIISESCAKNILLQTLHGFCLSLEKKTGKFFKAEMIVKSPFYIFFKYRVGLYQLTGFRLFPVPLFGKTGPTLYFLYGIPSYTKHFLLK
jgi:hypothetical protein